MISIPETADQVFAALRGECGGTAQRALLAVIRATAHKNEAYGRWEAADSQLTAHYRECNDVGQCEVCRDLERSAERENRVYARFEWYLERVAAGTGGVS